jgi:hypothetical protein
MPKKNKRTKRKKAVARKIAPKKKVARKKAASRKSSLARKKKKTSPKRKRVPSKGRGVETVALRSGEPQERRGGQSGDLQGLSSRPTADSESVEELLEEGNALEAEVLQGVENAPDADQGQVRTREVPEDDVPQEYLDKDR